MYTLKLYSCRHNIIIISEFYINKLINSITYNDIFNRTTKKKKYQILIFRRRMIVEISDFVTMVYNSIMAVTVCRSVLFFCCV